MESVLLLSAAASAAADNTVTVRRYRDGLRLSDREVSLRVSGPTSGTVAAAAVVTVDGGRGSGRPEATRSNPPNKYGRKLHRTTFRPIPMPLSFSALTQFPKSLVHLK